MRFLYPLLPLLCLACTKPASLSPGRVSAQLNDSTWAGRVQAIPADAVLEKPCAKGKITLMIKTDFPYAGNMSFTKPTVVNGCLNDTCTATQRLNFQNLPLRTGRYKLAQLNECGTMKPPEGDNYWLLVNGSGLLSSFRPLPGKTSWVRITRIDRAANTIAGTFNLALIGGEQKEYTRHVGGVARTSPAIPASVIRFRRGHFVARLPK